MKKLCIVTGSRSEYSSYYPLLKLLSRERSIRLQIIATGMHLCAKYGYTYKEIEKDGYRITRKIPILLFGESEKGVAKSIGLGIMRFSEAFARLKPDMALLIGDRFETFAAAVSAFVAGIPIAHIGGGDLTRGAMDDSFRHSITKMSCLHFVSTALHRARVIQLGEDPRSVFAVGAPGIDNIRDIRLLKKSDLENLLGIRFGRKNAVVTYHPVTLDKDASGKQFRKVLKALGRCKDLFVIFTKPNADSHSGAIIRLTDEYVKRNPGRGAAFKSLGQLRYLSLLKYVDVVIGNSSSGIVEVPLFGIPTVNIGDRQEGRVKSAGIIDCEAEEEPIYRAIKKALDKKPGLPRLSPSHLYGKGDAAQKILKVIKARLRGKIEMKKGFHDLPAASGSRAGRVRG